MTVHEMAERLTLEALATPEADREISGVYIGDLLSWVIGRAKGDQVWITIMSNINIVAVATLADVACVILAEGVRPEAEIIETARQKGVNLYTSDKTAYELAASLAELLK